MFSYCRIGTSKSVSHFLRSTLKRFIVDENYSLLPDPRDHCFWIDFKSPDSSVGSLTDSPKSKTPTTFQSMTHKVIVQRHMPPVKDRLTSVMASIIDESNAKSRDRHASPANKTIAQFAKLSADMIKESIANRTYSRPE